MPSYVVFLRAVNVGGRVVRMADLRGALEAAGFTDVATHIQSGNVFVRSGRRSTGAVGTEMAGVLGELDRVRRAVHRAHAGPAARGARRGGCRATPHRRRPAVRRVRRRPGARRGRARSSTTGTGEGERCRVLGSEILAELANGFQNTKLTNTRIERITGRTTTWRDLKVVRALDEKWGA